MDTGSVVQIYYDGEFEILYASNTYAVVSSTDGADRLAYQYSNTYAYLELRGQSVMSFNLSFFHCPSTVVASQNGVRNVRSEPSSNQDGISLITLTLYGVWCPCIEYPLSFCIPTSLGMRSFRMTTITSQCKVHHLAAIKNNPDHSPYF